MRGRHTQKTFTTPKSWIPPIKAEFPQTRQIRIEWWSLIEMGWFRDSRTVYSECDEDLGLSRRRPGDSEEIGKRWTKLLTTIYGQKPIAPTGNWVIMNNHSLGACIMSLSSFKVAIKVIILLWTFFVHLSDFYPPQKKIASICRPGIPEKIQDTISV